MKKQKSVKSNVLHLLQTGKRTIMELNRKCETADAGKCISRLRREGNVILSERDRCGHAVYWIDAQLNLDLV